MSFTHRVTDSYTPGDSASIVSTRSLTGDNQQAWEVAVAAETNDVQVLANVDLTYLKAVHITSDQDVTLETNSSSAADDTIALKANNALIWAHDSYFANPFSVDISALYFSNAGATAATVKIWILTDSTP